MNLFNWFKKKENKVVYSPNLVEILNSNGFNITEEEFENMRLGLIDKLGYTFVLPEQVWTGLAELTLSSSKDLMEYVEITKDLPENMRSNIPELIERGIKYIVCISMHAPRNNDYLSGLMKKALNFVAISEIARTKDIEQYIIKSNEKVGLTETNEYSRHPLNVLLSDI